MTLLILLREYFPAFVEIDDEDVEKFSLEKWEDIKEHRVGKKFMHTDDPKFHSFALDGNMIFARYEDGSQWGVARIL